MVSFGARESSHPLVSVIIPTYNRAGILKKCLSAIALQHFPFGSFEIIVVDDGSSDNTEEVVRQVSSRFEIRYFHQNNSGPAAARNRGVQHARSELILIMNDDAIAANNLVAGHYYMHRKMKSKRLAVLGTREFRNEDKVRTLNFLYDQVPLGLRVNSQMQGFYSADYSVTFNISMGKRDFEETGGFDEDFPNRSWRGYGIWCQMGKIRWRTLFLPAAQSVPRSRYDCRWPEKPNHQVSLQPSDSAFQAETLLSAP